MNINDSLDIESSTDDDYNFDAPNSGNLLELNVNDTDWFYRLNTSLKEPPSSSEESSVSITDYGNEENKENIALPGDINKQLTSPEGDKNDEIIDKMAAPPPAIIKLTTDQCEKNRINATVRQQPSAALISIKLGQVTTGKQIKRTFGMPPPPPPTAVKPYQTLNRLQKVTVKPPVPGRLVQTLPRKLLTVPIAPSFMTANRNQAKDSNLRNAALENKNLPAQKAIRAPAGIGNGAIAHSTRTAMEKKPIYAPTPYTKCSTATKLKVHLTVPRGPKLMTEARVNAKDSNLRNAALENKNLPAQKAIRAPAGIGNGAIAHSTRTAMEKKPIYAPTPYTKCSTATKVNSVPQPNINRAAVAGAGAAVTHGQNRYKGMKDTTNK